MEEETDCGSSREMLPMLELENQVAIISGGLGDIGRAIGRELARLGASVGVGDILEETEAGPFLADLREMGRAARYDRVDTSKAAEVEQWVARVEADLGTPTLIIPNAAIVTMEGIRTITPAQWERELQVNLNGAFYLAQAGAKRLLAANRPGRIVFTGSWAAHAVHTRLPAYCVAKAGLRMLCQCMALDLAPAGILVNEVAPGFVDAGLTGKFFNENPGIRETSAALVPHGLLIDPEEVARAVAFLCLPSNRQMVGSTLLMDGGLSLVTPGTRRDG